MNFVRWDKGWEEEESLPLSSQGGHNVSCYPIHIIPTISNFFSAFYTSLAGEIDVNYFKSY